MTITRILRPAPAATTTARRAAVVLAASVVATAALASSVPAHAAGKGGGRAIKASSTCADTGLLKVKAKPDTGGVLEVGGELDTNVDGQVWSVSVLDNGVSVWTATLTTAAPSGAFGAATRIPNLPGADVVTLVATLNTPQTPETPDTLETAEPTVCSASVTI